MIRSISLKSAVTGLALAAAAIATPCLADWNHNYISAPTNASRDQSRMPDMNRYNPYDPSASSRPGITSPEGTANNYASNALGTAQPARGGYDSSGDNSRADRQLAQGQAALTNGKPGAACQAFSAAETGYQAAGNFAGVAAASDLYKRNCIA